MSCCFVPFVPQKLHTSPHHSSWDLVQPSSSFVQTYRSLGCLCAKQKNPWVIKRRSWKRQMLLPSCLNGEDMNTYWEYFVTAIESFLPTETFIAPFESWCLDVSTDEQYFTSLYTFASVVYSTAGSKHILVISQNIASDKA